MGTRSDIAEVLSTVRWSEEGSYLGEIVKSINTGGFPCIVKVVRGQYQNIGHPSFSNPSLVSHLLLISAGKQQSIAAQCVKFKNQNQRVVVPFGPTLAIPQHFEGHFEILSEDGKSVPAIQSVEGLTRKFPDSCLVRESIKGYKADSPPTTNLNLINNHNNSQNSSSNNKSSSSSNNSVVNNINSTNSNSNHESSSLVPIPIVGPEITPYYRISDKNRIVQSGEVLILVGEVSVPSSSGKKVTRYLRCFDSKGQTVYLNTSQKGKFSPLARQDSISGVHTTKNLLNKRMPMMVRLVDGKPPVMPFNKNYSSFKKFVPELRLFSTIQEELIFGMLLSQNSKEAPHILPLPLSAPLKFQVCCNFAQVEQMKEFCRLHEKMKTMMDVAKNLIQIYDINLKKELRFDGRQWKAYSPPVFFNSSTPTSPQHFSSTSHGSGDVISNSPNPYSNHNYEIPDVQDYEDIDQIYDYVRGVKPVPPQLQKIHTHSTAKVVISETSTKQKLSRSNGIHHGIVEKRITKQHQVAYQHKINGQSKMSASSTTCIVVNKDEISHQQLSGPCKPPRRVGMRRSLSVDRLIDINADDGDNGDDDDDDGYKPEPPPIETIPTNKNKLALCIQNGGHYKRAEETAADGDNGVDDDETVFNNYNDEDEEEEDDDGVKVTSGNNYYEVTCNNTKETIIEQQCQQHQKKQNFHRQISSSHRMNHYQEIIQQPVAASIKISSADDDSKKKNLQKQKNTSKVLISSSNESSPNNTSTTSGVSTSSGCAILITSDHTNHVISSANNCVDEQGGGGGGKVKKHHYVKRNGPLGSKVETSNAITINNPSSPSGIISGSPSNRILFRRSPIFDFRYKSMNDLNRNSLESGASGSSSSGGGGGGLGSKLSRYFQFPHAQHVHNNHYHPLHSHNHNPPSSASKQYMGVGLNRGSQHYHSNSNINVNLLNLNIKASSRHKALFRPKSLINLIDINPNSSARFGNSSSCRKKLLDNMVVPNHHHAIHSSAPSFDLFHKLTNSSSSSSSKRNSCASSGGSRNHSHLPSLYL